MGRISNQKVISGWVLVSALIGSSLISLSSLAGESACVAKASLFPQGKTVVGQALETLDSRAGNEVHFKRLPITIRKVGGSDHGQSHFLVSVYKYWLVNSYGVLETSPHKNPLLTRTEVLANQGRSPASTGFKTSVVAHYSAATDVNYEVSCN